MTSKEKTRCYECGRVLALYSKHSRVFYCPNCRVDLCERCFSNKIHSHLKTFISRRTLERRAKRNKLRANCY